MRIFHDVRTMTMAKRGIAVASAVAVLVCGVAPAYAWWRPILIGPPYWGPYYAPPVVVEPSPPPVVVQPTPPPVVVQPAPPPLVVQPQAPQVYVQPDDRAVHDFYYCESAKAFYPNVKDCPQGWTRVAPQPTAGGVAK